MSSGCDASNLKLCSRKPKKSSTESIAGKGFELGVPWSGPERNGEAPCSSGGPSVALPVLGRTDAAPVESVSLRPSGPLTGEVGSDSSPCPLHPAPDHMDIGEGSRLDTKTGLQVVLLVLAWVLSNMLEAEALPYALPSS